MNGLLIGILLGYCFRMGWEYFNTYSQAKKFEQYQQNAMLDLQNFQKQVHEDLFKANEEFAKMQLGKLLLELLKDLIKEKK